MATFWNPTGLVAGTVSMALGEYVSVSSQRDAELAQLTTERRELRDDPDGELAELTAIYQAKGVRAGNDVMVSEQRLL
jgi:VIT1/CCC1 family predicted Fe2+/Mn2+ transporter